MVAEPRRGQGIRSQRSAQRSRCSGRGQMSSRYGGIGHGRPGYGGRDKTDVMGYC